MKPHISIVVPAYNEEKSVPLLYERVAAVFSALPYDFELLFVDDGSTDGTAAAVEELHKADPRVRLLELSRNFGKEVASSAGLWEATGDAVILMDADLQHPPETIPELIGVWEQGSEVVVGVRNPRASEGALRKLMSRGFAKAMNAIADIQAPAGATDFRLLDRKVTSEFKKLSEHKRLTRSLIDWLGFKRAYLPFDAAEREDGKARYSYRKLFGTAFFALIAHSRWPLWLAGYLGVAITLFSGGLGLFIIIEQIILNDPLTLEFSGPAMLAVLILFLNGIVLISLWLISLYISTIHTEAAARPLYVARRRLPAHEE